MKLELPRRLLVPAYTVGVIGVLLQIAGGYWDVSWHLLGWVETFFIPPHTVLYTGIALALLAGLLGLYMRWTVFGRKAPERLLLTGLHVSLVGSGMQVVAGPADFWWHANFGFDPFLFTPSHALITLGIVLSSVGMAIGSVRLLQARRSNLPLVGFVSSSKWLQFLGVVALTTLWLALNALISVATDVPGIAYTFQLGEGFRQYHLLAFATAVTLMGATGTLVFLGAKTILRWKGAATAIAGLTATLSVTTNLGFRAWALAGTEEGTVIASFLPLYLSFVALVFLFDLLIRETDGKWKVLLAAASIGPVASYLDGFHSLALWTQVSYLIPILIIPMFLAGMAAGLSRVRFANTLLSENIAATTRAG